ncbi:RimK family protein [Govanella unica]|uniref:RimK family protein n=1 Tax=Govanella unica TaxID=2975056 RepID=A0A9X3U1H9_9PROT|nr:RimK family protein [Govania unica]MDA5194844.1 RimK family protein [Govania unica]
MTQWVILVENPKDFPNAETPHKVITTRDYLSRAQLFAGARPNLINLARSYNYQSEGYYCSLLAEARGQRILPSAESMLELGGRLLYAHALPDLEDVLNKCAHRLDHPPTEAFDLLICFNAANLPDYDRLAREIFDWFRYPIIEVSIEVASGSADGEPALLKIKRIRARTIDKLEDDEITFLHDSLRNHTKREWRSPKQKTPADWSLAVLYDPKEDLPPSSFDTLKRFARVAAKMNIDVEPITKKDMNRLVEFDALFIRETTSINNHTYQFARRAAQEGMPVIDDPVSMIRCTNKIYLNELLSANDVATPKTMMITHPKDIEQAVEFLGLPMVVKIPDGSFSRGVHKADSLAKLRKLIDQMFEDTDLILAQEFMPTELDWRVGVLGGEPLFACQYFMAKKHWQIIQHKPDGSAIAGGFKTFAVEDTPPHIIDIGLRAANLIGSGLYGVDIKENGGGAYVIEVNDNPNLDHGVEDAALKDELWARLVRWFVTRLEQ